MTDLPPDLTAFAQLLDAQPEPVRAAFHYCLALMMVEAGKARLIETRPGEAGRICVFESSAGERFSLVRPGMSEEQEAEVRERLRGILGEEGF
jgi:hypothetical protein